MRPSGVSHLGQPTTVWDCSQARRRVWSTRSTPLNWELLDFANQGQPVSVCETAAQK